MATTLPAPLNVQQIQQQAQQQANAEVDQQTAPLQGQITSLQGQSQSAQGAIGSLFDSLQPQVNQSANAVDASYQGAEQQQNSIFTAATARLNQMKQDRAAQAQALAQQIGGPVAIGEFTAGYDPAISSLINLGAGDQLHTLAYGQAGVQAAQAFAGQVFPLARTEQEGQARQYYQNQVSTIQSQIDNLNATKGSLADSKATDLQQANLQYQLQSNQQALDKLNADRTYKETVKNDKAASLKADRDWQTTLHTLKNDDARVALAQNQFSQGKKVQDTTISLNQQKLTDAEKSQAAALDLSNKEFSLKKTQLATQTRLADKKLAADQALTWNQYLDAAVNPQPGKTVTSTQAVPVAAAAAITGKVKDAYADKSSPTGYSQLVTTHQTAQSTPITDPNALVDYMVAHNTPKARAINMVRARLQIPTWKYGQPVPKGK